MATVRMGISKNQEHTAVLMETGDPVVTNDTEITFDLTANLSREDLLIAFKKLETYMMSLPVWPPVI